MDRSLSRPRERSGSLSLRMLVLRYGHRQPFKLSSVAGVSTASSMQAARADSPRRRDACAQKRDSGNGGGRWYGHRDLKKRNEELTWTVFKAALRQRQYYRLITASIQ